MGKTISFTLNGQAVSVEQSESMTVLEALREELQVTSPKDGCSPQGKCGCCTVMVNGKALMSCKQDLSKVDGGTVDTLEGMDPRKREVLARSFVKTGGLQCGFCIPGISMRVAGLLDRTPEPTEKQMKNALQPHLCRCTGYIKIFEAVREAALHWNADTMPEIDPAYNIGDGAARFLGSECVLGDKDYIDDMYLEGMLHGAVALSQYPRARVKSIDLSAAEALDGVVKVITAKDIPGAQKVGLIVKDWPVFIAEGQATHCTGSVIAAVAATSRDIARKATELIKVDYEVLEPVTDPVKAIEPDSPQVHEGQSNHYRTCIVKRGDIDKALAESTHVLTETFDTQRIEHAFLEPEAALAVPEGDGLHIYTQGQGVHDDQKQLASIMDWPLEKIRVTLVSNGGAFGGKEDLSIQQHTMLLAHHTQQPVKLTLTRDQSIRMHPKRHPLKMTYTVGCDAEGRLKAVKAYIIGDTGAYASVGDKVLERAAGHSCGAYSVEAVDVEALTVYTNNYPCGAFRGFGVNQTAFAIEGMLDRLAEKVGIDGYDMRERNILEEGKRFGPGQIMNEGIGLRQTLEALKDTYKNAKYVGIACGIKNTGIGNGMPDIGRALIEVNSPTHLTLYTGYTEMGQGLFTVLRQIVFEEVAKDLGVEPQNIDVKVNTDYAVECGMTTASRGTVLAGEATRRACAKMREAASGGKTLSDMQDETFHGEFICDFTCKPGTGGEDEITHLTFGYATQVVILNDDGSLREVVAAHDVGRVMNRVQCEGQIEGSIHMGLGYALTEDLPCEGGYPVSTDLNDLGIIRSKHVPEIKVKLLEVPDPLTHYGAKGVGEIGLVPTAAAVAGALRSFDGIYRIKLPMKGSAAARAILPKRLHEEDHE